LPGHDRMHGERDGERREEGDRVLGQISTHGC
jgi:hypothetical protein